jgi:hypothetical protein
VGQSYIRASLGLPAINARRNPEGLVAIAREGIDAWMAAHRAPAELGV